MLIDDEEPDYARDKVLLYAALSAEAGHIYLQKGNAPMARATFLNALRFTLRARTKFSNEGVPDYAPRIGHLLAVLKDAPLDAELTGLLRAAGPDSQ